MLEAGPVIAEIVGDPLHRGVQFTGRRVPADSVRLLAPVIPRSKILGIGRNYADHAREMGNRPPAQPLVSPRAQHRCQIGPDDPSSSPRSPAR